MCSVPPAELVRAWVNIVVGPTARMLIVPIFVSTPLNVADAPGMPAGRLIVPEFVSEPLTVAIAPGPNGRLIVPVFVTEPVMLAVVPDEKSIVPALETVAS